LAQYSRKLKRGIRYWYKFSFLGKTYYSKCIYHTKGEAKKAESTKYEELSTQERNPSLKSNIRLIEACNERLDFIKVKKSKKYYKDSKYYLSILVKQFGDVNIDSLVKTDFNNLFIKESEKLQANRQDNYKVNAMMRVYKALYNHAINDHDLNIKNPLVGMQPFSIQKKLKYIPSDEDIKHIQLTCNRRQNLLIDFVKETGARIGECFKIKGSDIFDDYIVLYTRKSKDSNLVPRKLPRPLCLAEVRLKPDDLLFPDWTEQPKFLVRKINKLYQKPWGFHNLRHRYASLLSKQGKPLYEIMILLGHSNLSTTQIYLQLL